MTTDNYGVEKDTTQDNTVGSYLVRHNDKIIGLFSDESEATNAMNGYSMDNNIEINDTLDVLKIHV